MAKKFTLIVDEAVWERREYELEIPDEITDPEAMLEYARQQLDQEKVKEYEDRVEVIDGVLNMDKCYMLDDENGERVAETT